jgi:deoxycytidylate deaminase
MMPQPITFDLSQPNVDRTVANSIEDRLSQELIIALVGPVGSGVSTSANYIQKILTHDFGYKVAPVISMSSFIKEQAHRVGIADIPSIPLSKYIDEMQTAGNALRKKFGGNYLAEKAVERIATYRRQQGGYAANRTQLPSRTAFIIDSIKNQEELNLLRTIYRETLCVFGIFAPDAIRKERLINNNADINDVQKVLDRDQSEVMTFGQMTRKVFVSSDFFICNDQKEDALERHVKRYLEIVFDTNIHTPTRAESAMYDASAAMANSACMSRQVGAAIVSATGELLSIGWNDVPKFGGSLYSEGDQSIYDQQTASILDRDHRCFKWANRICHNQIRREAIVDGIIERIVNSDLFTKGTNKEAITEILAGTAIEDLIEFSRSIHAEMEAILAVAREGRHSLVGATLYTTTYPCHNCARHIVASGISKVTYIQPYKKSLAIALHNDSITEDPTDRTKVVFRQYEGIAPHNYLRLFTPTLSRKVGGKFARQDPKQALPIFRIPLDGPVDYEAKVIADLSDKEQNAVCA